MFSEHLDRLIDALQDERPVLGVCGPEVSASVGYPTTQQFMEQLLAAVDASSHHGLSEDVWCTLAAGCANLPELAEWVAGRLSPELFRDRVRDTWSPRSSNDFSWEHELLVRLPIRLWLVGNYDLCMVAALTDHLKQAVTPADSIPTDQLLGGRGPLPTAVHLFGSIDHPEGMVITASQHQALMLRRPQGSPLELLSILFVGFRLGSDDLDRCLRLAQTRWGLSDGGHFALLPREPALSELEFEMGRNRLLRLGIQPIFYEPSEDDHKAREQAVQRIAERLGVDTSDPRHELELHWPPREATVSTIRRRLAELFKAFESPPGSVLRTMSLDRGSLSLALPSESDRNRVRLTAEKTDFFQLAPSGDGAEAVEQDSVPRTKMQPVKRRDGGRFEAQRGQVMENALVSLEDLQAMPGGSATSDRAMSAAEEHLVMVHSAMLGTLDPSSVKESSGVLKPLMPPPLPFGLVDVFQPELDWRLDSPIVHVWFHTEAPEGPDQPETVVGLTALGLGPRQVREEIEAAAYATLLAMPDAAESVITHGLIHLTSVQHAQAAAPGGILGQLLAFVGFGGGGGIPATKVPPTAKEALAALRARFERMAEETGFVQVHRCDYANLRRLVAALRKQLMRVKTGSPPTLFNPCPEAGVLLWAYPYFPGTEYRLPLRLSGDLLKSPEMETLLDAYYRDVLVRLRADLERRIQFYEHELAADRERVRWFNGLSQKEQDEQPPVTLNRKILDDLAINVPLEGGERVSMREYVHRLEAHFIPDHDKKLEQMKQQREPIARLASTEYSNVWRQCVARIFDCTLRDVPLCADERINRLFDEWKRIAKGLLNVEWRRLLHNRGIHPDSIFKRTVYFDVIYDEEADTLDVFPKAIIDARRAVIEVDERQRTLAVHDPLDTAVTETLPEYGSDAARDALDALFIDGPDSKQLEIRLRKHLFERPDIAALVCDRTFRTAPSESQVNEIRDSVLERQVAASAGVRCIQNLDVDAYNSAIRALQPMGASDSPPGKALMIAFMRCLQAGFDPIRSLKRLRDDANLQLPADVVSAFKAAWSKDREAVNRFLEETILDRDSVQLTPVERIASDVEYCCEATRLADEFAAAAARWDSTGETQSTAFFKTESAFEAAYNALYCSHTPDLRWIQRILTGAPVPRDTVT